MLEFLMRHNNQSFSTTDLLLSIWPSETETAEGAVRQILYALRRKLKVEELADFVKTQPGGGYVIEGEAAL